MALHALSFALGTLLAMAQSAPAPQSGAPAAPPTARYCLRVDPSVESRIETIRCETRADWAALDVNLDAEWAMWGVKVVNG